MIPTVIPTVRTMRLADVLWRETYNDTAVDAVLNHLDHIYAEADQIPALVAIILGKIPRPPGRPAMADEFTPEQRKESHAAFQRGCRRSETRAGETEYQRVNARERRAQKAT